MPTRLQEKLADEIIKDIKNDRPSTAGKLLAKVRYSKGLQKQPCRIFRSKGVIKALEIKGFSIDEADKVVSKLLHKSKSDKIKINAAQEIYKRLGAYSPEKSINLNASLVISEETKEKSKKAVNEFLRGDLK